MSTVNPFAKRDSFTSSSLGGYKFLTILSWLIVLITTFTHTFSAPPDGQHDQDRDGQHDKGHHYDNTHSRTIWGQNSANNSPFALNSIITSTYWLVLFLFQLGYIQRLFSNNTTHVTSACNVGSHFILHNALHFTFIMLWTRGKFYWGLVILIIDFSNLVSLYLRHSTTPLIIHVATVSGPLAFVIVALFWDGAAAVHAQSLAARLTANVFVWWWLVVGWLFLVAFRDWTFGLAMSWLSASLAVHQMMRQVVALQWIFAWVIAGILLASTVLIAVPGVFGQKVEEQIEAAPSAGEDREREPLLANAGGNNNPQ